MQEELEKHFSLLVVPADFQTFQRSWGWWSRETAVSGIKFIGKECILGRDSMGQASALYKGSLTYTISTNTVSIFCQLMHKGEICGGCV